MSFVVFAKKFEQKSNIDFDRVSRLLQVHLVGLDIECRLNYAPLANEI